MNEDDQIGKNVDSIIDQLKNQTRSLKQTQKNPPPPQLKPEDLGQYVIDKTSTIIEGFMEVIGVIQDEIKCAPDPKLIEAAATYMNAFTSSLDGIGKMEIAQQKIKAQKDIAHFNASVRLANNESNDKNEKGLYLSREELLKGVLEYKKDEIREITEGPVDV